jgi:restriction endonuclease S subunit
MSELFAFKDADIHVLDDLIKENSVELGRGDVISKIDIRDTPGPYPIYSSSAQNNGKMGEYGKFMFDEELITWSVDGGGKFFYRPKHKFSVTNVCGYLRLKSKRIDYKYLHSILEFQHERLSFDYQNKAHPSVIRELYQVPLLEIEEQQKIAEILTSVDEVIEKTQSQINKLEDLKKATMNELLTKGISHTEFKETEIGRIPKVWKTCNLSEVCTLINGRAYSLNEWEKEGTPVIRLQNLTNYGGTFYYSNLVLPDKNYCHKGDLLYMWSASFGPFIWWGDKAIFHYHIWKIEPNHSLILKKYLFYLLEHRTDAWKSKSSGMAMFHLTKEGMEKEILAVPSLDEQSLISEILETIKKQVEDQQDKLTFLKNLKKSLMQDLLTGKVRVTMN